MTISDIFVILRNEKEKFQEVYSFLLSLLIFAASWMTILFVY